MFNFEFLTPYIEIIFPLSLIIAIMRGRNIIFPTGNDVIKENDIIVVIDTKDEIRDINDILG